MALIRTGGGSASASLQFQGETVQGTSSPFTITLPTNATVVGIKCSSTFGSGIGASGMVGVVLSNGLTQVRTGAGSTNVTAYSASISDNVITVTWSATAGSTNIPTTYEVSYI